ncbi:MAG: SUF system Fe-S cluster assembly regulator [Alphaproteobacteria bacterium]
MIRLTRLADYAVLLMTHMGHEWQRDASGLHNAASLSDDTYIPAPTVAKLLGVMSRGGLLASSRGQSGGYRLARDPADISVADIVSVVDGPIALTDCIEDGPGECNIESLCGVRGAWQKINNAIRTALDDITLAELCADQAAMFDAPLNDPAVAEPVPELQ